MRYFLLVAVLLISSPCFGQEVRDFTLLPPEASFCQDCECKLRLAELNAKKALAEQAVYFHMRMQALADEAYRSRAEAAMDRAEIEKLAMEAEQWKAAYYGLLEILQSECQSKISIKIPTPPRRELRGRRTK